MGLVVTVDGSWEISDSLLVTWYNVKCDVFGKKEMFNTLPQHIKKNVELA